AFENLDQMLFVQFRGQAVPEGSTAATLIRVGDVILVANLGDSAVYYGEGPRHVAQVSYRHTLEDPLFKTGLLASDPETDRVRELGGLVQSVRGVNRVAGRQSARYGGLTVPRSFGDGFWDNLSPGTMLDPIRKIVSGSPTIGMILKDQIKYDGWFALVCDGVADTLSIEAIAAQVAGTGDCVSSQEGILAKADRVVKATTRAGSADNMSCTILNAGMFAEISPVKDVHEDTPTPPFKGSSDAAASGGRKRRRGTD
ncbi:hypothetical protein EBR96_04505, partial [bacterium]|nr:hypothetical protein [bacterium]